MTAGIGRVPGPGTGPGSFWHTRPRPRHRRDAPGPVPGPVMAHPSPAPAPALEGAGAGCIYSCKKNQIIFPKNANFFRFLVLRANCQQRFFVGDLHRAISNWKFFGLRLEANPKFLRGQFFIATIAEMDAIFAQKRSKITLYLKLHVAA